MSKPIIEVKDYSYRYASTEELVLKNITFTVNEGDFVGVVGCNRAGKSTLCKSIVGILPFVSGGDWSGEIVIDGKSLNDTKGNGTTDVVGIVFQDAESLFKRDEGKKRSFTCGKKNIEVWDLSGFEIDNSPHKLRVIRYHESWKENERRMWLVTTLDQGEPRVLWEMMNRRWDIEENGFHQLKTYYHAKHCYCHAATEVIFDLMIIGFNMRELYLYRRIQRFKESGISRKSVNRKFCDELLLEKVKSILYEKGG